MCIYKKSILLIKELYIQFYEFEKNVFEYFIFIIFCILVVHFCIMISFMLT